MVSKTADLLTEWVFEGDLVSKMPNLLTEWVFEGDLVSKTPHLLTDWGLESNLVSKMADLLTEKGAERGRCYPHSVATIIGIRRGYPHSDAISKSRAGVSAGLGGFVGFRQLPSRHDECDGLAKIDWASGSERPTGVTAGNLRSRRPDSWPAPEAHAPLARNRERGAEELPHARASQDEAVRGQSSTYIHKKIAGRGRR